MNDNQTNQIFTFILRDECFAVEIFKVREVLDVSTLTRIPRMPGHINGVINLRGSVVPVLDLGLKLGMPPFEQTVNTCIMIVEVEVEEEMIQIGVLTDMVQEVIDLNVEDLEGSPKMGTNLNTEFIRGMGRKDDKFMILLNIDLILASDNENQGLDLPEGANIHKEVPENMNPEPEQVLQTNL